MVHGNGVINDGHTDRVRLCIHELLRHPSCTVGNHPDVETNEQERGPNVTKELLSALLVSIVFFAMTGCEGLPCPNNDDEQCFTDLTGLVCNEPMITHRLSLEEAAEGFDLAVKKQAAKVVFVPQ